MISKEDGLLLIQYVQRLNEREKNSISEYNSLTRALVGLGGIELGLVAANGHFPSHFLPAVVALLCLLFLFLPALLYVLFLSKAHTDLTSEFADAVNGKQDAVWTVVKQLVGVLDLDKRQVDDLRSQNWRQSRETQSRESPFSKFGRKSILARSAMEGGEAL